MCRDRYSKLVSFAAGTTLSKWQGVIHSVAWMHASAVKPRQLGCFWFISEPTASVLWVGFPVMPPNAPSERAEQQRLRLFLYLIPLVGLVPAGVNLYLQRSNRPQPEGLQRSQRKDLQVSRQSVSLAAVWGLALAMVNLGGQLGETPQLTVMLLNSVLTSGYFIASFWLMVQLGRGKRPEIPGLDALGNRLP